MLSELEQSDETLLAARERALVSPLVLVLEQMVPQAGLGSELFLAFVVRTNIRSFLSMNAFVVVQSVGSLE